jgi:hypothetical protein
MDDGQQVIARTHPGELKIIQKDPKQHLAWDGAHWASEDQETGAIAPAPVKKFEERGRSRP